MCAAAVRSASQLPAASHQHLVRAADGLHAVAEPLEEVAAVDRLRTADAFVLYCVHHRARLQGRSVSSRAVSALQSNLLEPPNIHSAF